MGIIHMAQIKIGAHHFPCSFTILEVSVTGSPRAISPFFCCDSKQEKEREPKRARAQYGLCVDRVLLAAAGSPFCLIGCCPLFHL